MHTDLFALLCDELGYEPSTVLIIRISQDDATVTYTEPSGMPRGHVHPIDGDVGQPAA
jgi:hypothetical protein